MAKAKKTNGGTRPANYAWVLRLIFIVATTLFFAAGILLWRNAASTPEQVFYDMLDNNLRSRGMARRVLQDNGAQTLDQTLQAQTGSQNVVKASTLLTQGANGDTKVITESIGTPSDDYVRYVDIRTRQLSSSGSDFDFSNVLGVWGKSGMAAGQQQQSGELYGEAILGVIPFGYVAPEDRKRLIQEIRRQNIFEIDYSQVKRETQGGRPRYIYSASISPEKYVTMLKQFGKSMGLKQLEAFDPESFRDSPPLKFELVVDIWSRQLRSLNFTGTERKEAYSSYGVESPISLPQQFITIDELQERLQSIQ